MAHRQSKIIPRSPKIKTIAVIIEATYEPNRSHTSSASGGDGLTIVAVPVGVVAARSVGAEHRLHFQSAAPATVA